MCVTSVPKLRSNFFCAFRLERVYCWFGLFLAETLFPLGSWHLETMEELGALRFSCIEFCCFYTKSSSPGEFGLFFWSEFESQWIWSYNKVLIHSKELFLNHCHFFKFLKETPSNFSLKLVQKPKSQFDIGLAARLQKAIPIFGESPWDSFSQDIPLGKLQILDFITKLNLRKLKPKWKRDSITLLTFNRRNHKAGNQ